jgi:hypothetical protein
VRLYRAGVLWTEEADVPCAGLSVDLPMCDDVTTFPYEVDEQGATELSVTMLHPVEAAVLSRSAIVRMVAAAAWPWRPELRWRYREDQHMVDALCDERVCDELTRLMDVGLLLTASGRHVDLHETGMAVLRRMQPVGCSRAADYRASSVHDYGVARFKRLPVTAKRLAQIFALVGENAADARWSAHGVLWGRGKGRIMGVPRDADTAGVTMAAASLLAVPEGAVEDRDLVLRVGELQRDAGGGVVDDTPLVPYRIILVPDGVRLNADTSMPTATHGRGSLDDVPTDIPTDVARTRREDVQEHFPLLAQRLAPHEDNVVLACIREAQARRVVSEWCLENIDVGGNLSGLGLSVLLAITLGFWCGAKVRVYMGPGRVACVGYWGGDDGMQLLDPTRTLKNAFDVALHLWRMPDAEWWPTRQSHIEVRFRKHWHVCRVVSVCGAVAKVDVLLIGRRRQVLLSAVPWRRMARSEDTDVDQLLRRGIVC